MPKLTPQTRKARRHRITEAALICFSRKGFSATSINDIIKESGLSAGSIYSHFAGKEEILTAAASQAFETLRETLSKTYPDSITPAEFYRFITGDTSLPVQLRAVLTLMGEAVNTPALRDIAKHNLGHVRDSLAKTLVPWAENKTEKPLELAERTADQILMLFHGYTVRISVDTSADPVQLAHLGAQLLPG